MHTVVNPGRSAGMHAPIRFFRTLAVAAFALLIPAGVAQGGNVLSNPGFETGNLNSWNGNGVWSVTNTDAHTGQFSAILSGPNFFSLEQGPLNLDPAQVTELSVWLRATETGFRATLLLKDGVGFITGQTLPILDVTTTWTKFDFTFAKDSIVNGQIGFVSLSPCTGCSGALLADDFLVNVGPPDTGGDVPEPGTLSLTGAAVIALAARIGRRGSGRRR